MKFAETHVVVGVALVLSCIGGCCWTACDSVGYGQSLPISYFPVQYPRRAFVPLIHSDYALNVAWNRQAESQWQPQFGSLPESCCQICNIMPENIPAVIDRNPAFPVSVELPEMANPQVPYVDPTTNAPEIPADEAALGRLLFYDESLSHPRGQSCATCHSPDAGFADPDHSLPVSRGAVPDRVGSRNTPSAAYAAFSPPLHYDEDGETYVGGLFWDGRANSLSDQAKGPPLNPLEMNNADKQMILTGINNSNAAILFRQIHGRNALDASHAELATDQMADAIAAFESSNELNAFTSKYDAVLRGNAVLTDIEAQGLRLFNGKANCAACHPSTVTGNEPGPLFTDFSYDNVGIPKNKANPFLALSQDLNPEGPNFTDHGLAITVAKTDPLRAKQQDGKFKVPSLRNVELTAPYGHNGYFRTLKEIVHFYNTRDLESAGWEHAEIPATVNHDELGDLQLSDAEEDAIIAFLLTLTDR